MDSLWNIMKKTVTDKQSPSAGALVGAINIVCIKEISVEFYQNLISNMPRRIQAVASWWVLLMADLYIVLLSGSSVTYCWMLGLCRPIRDRRRSGR